MANQRKRTLPFPIVRILLTLIGGLEKLAMAELLAAGISLLLALISCLSRLISPPRPLPPPCRLCWQRGLLVLFWSLWGDPAVIGLIWGLMVPAADLFWPESPFPLLSSVIGALPAQQLMDTLLELGISSAAASLLTLPAGLFLYWLSGQMLTPHEASSGAAPITPRSESEGHTPPFPG